MASTSQTYPTVQLSSAQGDAISQPRVEATITNAQAIGQSDRGQPDDTKVVLRDYRFWLILVALSVALLMAALESTVIVTTLPTISTELDIGEKYVWVANVVMLSSAATQPLIGQLANLFGRRHLSLSVVAIYTLGSGICGGANGAAMLIAGRALQGIGTGGIFTMNDIIISDLVPLRHRGNFIAVVLLVYGIGTFIGPFAGGIIVQNTSWRWVFYINLPIGGLALFLLFVFLRVKWNRTISIWEKVKRIDFIGNILVIASTISMLTALTWTATYPWSSYRIIVPLVVGFFGLCLFICFEGSGYAAEPVMPLRLFGNRTSAIIYCTTFLNGAMLYWGFFFLPVFFQAVQGATPAQSGVYLLPASVVAIPGAALSVFAVSKWGRYKPLHIIGFALFTLGLGLMGIMDRKTTTAQWAWIEILTAFGSGFLLNTQLPAFQAGLQESDQATATASWAFIRSLGSVWGIAIPATVFNTYAASRAENIDDPRIREIFGSGNAYASATKGFVEALPTTTQQQVIAIFTDCLQRVFWSSISFSGLALILSFIEKEIELRKDLETEYGLESKSKKPPPETG